MSYHPDYKYLPPIAWPILTPLYDFFCLLVGLGSRFKRKVLNSVSLQNGMTAADIGCGTGVFLKVAKQKYPEVDFIGIDPDKPTLAIAERRLASNHLVVELKVGFAESLPLADGSVDVCFSTLAFHHLPSEVKRGAAQEIYRVLKPGGRAVISDFGERKNRGLYKLLFFEKLEYLAGNLQGLIPRALQAAGFQNIRVIGRHFPGLDIIVAEK